MTEIPSTRENLSKLFYYTCNLYDSKRYPDFEAIYQFVLDEKGETYCFYVTVSGGKSESAEGRHAAPSITIYAQVSVWLDVASGKLNGLWGWLTRKYRTEGPFHYLKAFDKVFGRKILDIGKNSTQDFEIPRKRAWEKPDNVVIINGSPRKKSGFTYGYLSSLIKGIEQAGAKAEVIDIYDKKYVIEPCRGCFSCWTATKGRCVINDDANGIIEKFDNAYLLIYAFPLYIDSVPAKLKALIDRQFIHVLPLFVPYDKVTRHPVRNPMERYFALFSVSGFPEREQFDPVIKTFHAMARNWNRSLIATIVRPGAQSLHVGPPYHNYLKEVLKAIEQGGKEMIENGTVSKKTLKAISNDYGIPGNVWRNYTNLYWYLKGKNA
jgi:putative NADPH-quinone reductase/putative sterol carrier protein